MSSDSAFRVKCAGGAAAQVLALMNALYIKKNTGRNFLFDYFPYGTGTYWPFEIKKLLSDSEIGDTSKLSRGHEPATDQPQQGKIVQNHPINSQHISLEKVYTYIRRFKVDEVLLRIRGEIPINTTLRNLNDVKNWTKSVSGGFFPILDADVFHELDSRFKKAGLNSPFSRLKTVSSDYDLVIHYRIGDKRAKFSNPGVVGGDGVIDPIVFSNLISKFDLSSDRILVVSDEPNVAQQLLNGVGLVTEIPRVKNDIWMDISLMASAKVFIGTWSQVSHLASACVAFHGGRAFIPSSTGGENSIKWGVEGVSFYEPIFLDSSNSIYFQ
jgi:hypothetical protein